MRLVWLFMEWKYQCTLCWALCPLLLLSRQKAIALASSTTDHHSCCWANCQRQRWIIIMSSLSCYNLRASIFCSNLLIALLCVCVCVCVFAGRQQGLPRYFVEYSLSLSHSACWCPLCKYKLCATLQLLQSASYCCKWRWYVCVCNYNADVPHSDHPQQLGDWCATAPAASVAIDCILFSAHCPPNRIIIIPLYLFLLLVSSSVFSLLIVSQWWAVSSFFPLWWAVQARTHSSCSLFHH